MIIRINEDWRIRSDPHQWAVQRRLPWADGDKWQGESWHTTLDHAVVWLGRRRIQVMDGVYGPEALAPLCRALTVLQDETRAALADIQEQIRQRRDEPA